MAEILITCFFMMLCFAYIVAVGIFETWHVTALLIVILASALVMIIENKKIRSAIYGLYDLISFLFMPCMVFLPAFMFAFKENEHYSIHLPALAVILYHSQLNHQLIYILLLAIGALISTSALQHYEALLANYRLQRDSLTENTLLLQQKNQYLTASQESEVEIAALNERNRISRDIHDNVGHLLSSALLQTGAIEMLNTQEILKQPLLQLKDTLKQGIENTRQSVHQLYDTSLDLNFALSKLSRELPSKVSYTYQISAQLNYHTKQQILAIFQEAIQNILKHSNATAVQLRALEHPAFLQFEIADNGTDITLKKEGIGLANIDQRIREMNGHLTIETSHGFRLFFTIPKEGNS